MKEIPLTQDKVALVDDEDFSELNKYKWYADKIGNSYYAKSYDLSKNRKRILMHRIIIKIDDPNILVDHIDGDGLNNCKQNLRISNRSENGSNRTKIEKRNTSGFRGVFMNKRLNKWQSQITKNGKKIHLGYFYSKEDAAMAFDKKAKELFGEFCGKLNFQ